MHDYIDPAVGIPLAAILYLAWWAVERHHARARTRPNRNTTNEGA